MCYLPCYKQLFSGIDEYIAVIKEMSKQMKKIIIIMIFCLLMCTPCIAEAETTESIIEDVEYVENYDAQKTLDEVLQGKVDVTFSGILKKLVSLFTIGIKDNIPNIVKLVAVTVIAGIITNIVDEKNEIATFASVAVVGAISIKTFSSVLMIVTETIDNLLLFIGSLMTPIATVASSYSLTMSSAAATIFIAMQVFIYICKSVILPLICVIMVFSVVDKIGETPYLQGLNSLLKQVLKWGTGFMITIYGVIVGLQTQAAAGLDTLAGKSLKYAVGSFVPVVGNALSDSLETVISSAKTMTGALGITGVIGVGYICIVPLVNACAISISFKIASAITSVTGDKRVSVVINAFAQNIGSVVIVMLSVSVMFLISLAMLCGFGR